MKLIIQQGRVLDPTCDFDKITDVAIENGKIRHVGSIPSHFIPDKTIDASQKWVSPGLIDICCHPQIQHLHGSTLQQEAYAAVKRGITSLCISPDGDPILDTPANVLRLYQQKENPLPLPQPHFYPLGALSVGLMGESIADLTALAESGCIAFTNAQKPIKDLQILRNCYDYASSFNLLVVIQPQDPWLAKNGVAHEGLVATQLGLHGIPETAESMAVAQHLLLIEQTGIRAHFTCLSSKRSVELIAQAKSLNLPVSADTAMHSLHLTEHDLCDFDSNCHLYPPLRSINDRAFLLESIANSSIDAICSDHRPLEAIAKLAPFGDTLPGMSAFDSFLSLGIRLVNQNKISPIQLIDRLSSGPAQIFKLPGGTLKEGSPADICIIDPQKHWVVDEKTLFSYGKNTPFYGWELSGMITHTIIDGKVVYEI